jgi:hypothetical protein
MHKYVLCTAVYHRQHLVFLLHVSCLLFMHHYATCHSTAAVAMPNCVQYSHMYTFTRFCCWYTTQTHQFYASIRVYTQAWSITMVHRSSLLMLPEHLAYSAYRHASPLYKAHVHVHRVVNGILLAPRTAFVCVALQHRGMCLMQDAAAAAAIANRTRQYETAHSMCVCVALLLQHGTAITACVV